MYSNIDELSDLALLHNAVMQTNFDGKIIAVNQKFCSMTGYSEEELIGQNPRILNSNHHPKSFFQKLYLTLKSGKNWEGQIRNRNKSGQFYWVRITAKPLYDKNKLITSFIAIQTEITKLMKLETEVESLSLRLESIFTNVPIGILELNTKLEISHINPKGLELLGIKKSSKSFPWSNFKNFKELKRSILASLNSRQDKQVIAYLIEPNLEQEWYLKPLLDRDSNLSLLLLIADITERNQLMRLVISATEAEEARLSRKVHDTIGQAIAALCLKFSLLKNSSLNKKSDKLALGFEKDLRDTLYQVKNLAREHLAYHVEDGLGYTINILLEELVLLKSLKIMKLNLNLLDRLNKDDWLTVYRILREVLYNSVMHANADTIKFEVLIEANDLLIIIEDNGIGINKKTFKEGIGLKTISYRANLIGASLKYYNCVAGGFGFSLRVALKEEE